jgi:hypothetical protein
MLKHESNWASASMYNYILLKENNTQHDLEKALDRLLEKQVYTHPVGVPENISFEAYKEHPNAVKFYVHALTDVHLQSRLNYEISPVGNEVYIRSHFDFHSHSCIGKFCKPYYGSCYQTRQRSWYTQSGRFNAQ